MSYRVFSLRLCLQGLGTIALVLLIGACTPSEELRRSRQLLDDFPAPQASFQNHRQAVSRYLEQTQLEPRDANDVDYNLPFAIAANASVPFRGRFFLIHGLNDSPYVWHDTAKALAARGFDVRAILLPGHGNTPVAQLSVRWQDWLRSARTQLELWHDGSAPLYLGGFSLGGVIATTLALEQEQKEPGSVAGMLLVSPAWKSSRENLLRWAGLARHFKPWVFGGMILEDNPSRYNSLPINAMAQYYKGTRHLSRNWQQHRLAMPTLVVASFDDSVVDIAAVRQVFAERFTSPRSRLLLYDNDGTDRYRSSHASDDKRRAGAREMIRSGASGQDRILNQAHLSLINAPDNPLYGRSGTQLVCNGNDWPTFSACLYFTGEHWHGAEGTPSPDDTPIARTTFNPDFDFVLKQIDAVFSAEPAQAASAAASN